MNWIDLVELDLMGMEETTGKELDRKKIGDGLCADDVRAWALSVGRGQLLLWRPSHRHRARQGKGLDGCRCLDGGRAVSTTAQRSLG